MDQVVLDIGAAGGYLVKLASERGFDAQGNEDNEKAYQALLDDGMQPVAPDAGQIPAWRRAIRESNQALAAEGVVSSALLGEVECMVDAFRAGKEAHDCN